MRRSAAIIGVLLFSAAPLALMSGCEEESQVEEAADEAGDAVEETGDAVEEAADDMGG